MPSQKFSTICLGSYPRFDPGWVRLSDSNFSRIPTRSIKRFIKLIPPNGVTGLEEYSMGMLTILVLFFILQKQALFKNLTTFLGEQKSYCIIKGKRIGKKNWNYQKISVFTLLQSFATHLLEHGTALRYIQSLLGHESSKTTVLIVIGNTHITTKGFDQIKSPLDHLDIDD